MTCARVTQDEVIALIPSTSLTDLSLQIMCANELVNELALSNCGSSFSDNKLRCIELNLSAHFASIADPSLMILLKRLKALK